MVGYLLLAGKAKLPIVFGAAGLVLELILSGAQRRRRGSGWNRRCVRWTCGCSGARRWCCCGCAARRPAKCRLSPLPLAVYTVAHFLPPAATVAAVSFVVFSVVMLWFAASMIRAYNDARVKNKAIFRKSVPR